MMQNQHYHLRKEILKRNNMTHSEGLARVQKGNELFNIDKEGQEEQKCSHQFQFSFLKNESHDVNTLLADWAYSVCRNCGMVTRNQVN